MGDGGAAAELHAAVEPNIPVAELGAGGVHHVAFRIPDADYPAWPSGCRVMPSSGPVDRFYFRSLYFGEPNGILFEIATDGPGFVMDGPLETLGERHRPQLCASETSLSAPPIEAQMNQPACRRPYACAWCLGSSQSTQTSPSSWPWPRRE